MLSPEFLSRKILVGLLSVLSLATLIVAALISNAEGIDTFPDGALAEPAADHYATKGNPPAETNIAIRPEEALTPEAAEPATPGLAVLMERSRPVTLRTATETRTLWTMQSTLGSFLNEAGITVRSGDKVYADGKPIGASALSQAGLPDLVEIGVFVTVSIQDGTHRQLLRTSAKTVEAALMEAGITLDPADGVEPELDQPLSPELHISVHRAFPLTIVDTNRSIQIRSHQTNIDGALADAGIELYDQDYTIPSDEAILEANDVIRVVRVTENFRVVDESIPFQTIWQPTDELAIDSQAIISHGADGIRRQRIRVRYEDDVEVEQVVDSEWVAREPVNEVVGYGTRIELSTIDTAEGPREYWRVVRMRATSYTAASSGKDPGDPEYGLTASGRPAGFGVVAIDRNIVPFGSYVYVPGYGIGFAGDTGGGVRGRWIDLGYNEDNYVSWSGYVDVYYLTPVPPPGDINYLLPSALP